MDKEMEGVLARVGELIQELSAEYQSHLDEPQVTERAKNLFHEVLVKMRSAFDMTMNRIWQKYVPATLSPVKNQKAERAASFPICDDHAGF